MIHRPYTSLPQDSLAANTTEAQAAGERAARQAEAQGAAPCEIADAYHITFAMTMRRLGTPAACHCDFCQDLGALDDKVLTVQLAWAEA
jgi:hypothetical protein